MKKCLAFVSEGGWSDGIFVFLFFEGTIFLLFLKVTFLQQKMYASSVTASVSPLIFYLSFAFPNFALRLRDSFLLHIYTELGKPNGGHSS